MVFTPTSPSRRFVLAGALAAAAVPRAARSFDDPMTLLIQQARYLPALAQAQLSGSGIGPQLAAFVGDEATALAGEAAMQVDDLRLPDNGVALDAVSAVVREAAGYSVVLINEAHTASRHRQFVAELLAPLRAVGFTHLAAETFTNPDGDEDSIRALGPDGYLKPGHGYYTFDPVYAEMVRYAAGLGYRFLPYEMTPAQASTNDPLSTETLLRREQYQAENLAAPLKHDPSIKVVALAGYGHIREGGDLNFGALLGRRLEQPILTVEQASLGSFGPHAPDRPVVVEALRRFTPLRPIVLHADGALWGGIDTDIAVIHPSLPDVKGRPGWLARGVGRRLVPCQVPKVGEDDVILRASHATDPAPSIPADQVRAVPGQQVHLLLRPGQYRMELETTQGVRPIGTCSVLTPTADQPIASTRP